jgi:hypothetical protein
MKGPYERLKYDLRRVWECPACQRRERTAGTVTFRHCGCRMKQVDGQPVVMKLVEDGVERLAAAKASLRSGGEQKLGDSPVSALNADSTETMN